MNLRCARWLGWGALLIMLAGCSTGEQTREQEEALSMQGPSELTITIVRVGTGETAAAGRRVTVHYTGWLYHPEREGFRGRKFDSSRDRQDPFEFALGASEVIPGWDQGVEGMRVGEQRTLVIPSTLAYGRRGAGGVIPPDATLVFDIELLDVR